MQQLQMNQTFCDSISIHHKNKLHQKLHLIHPSINNIKMNMDNNGMMLQQSQQDRNIEELVNLVEDTKFDYSSLSNEEIVALIKSQKIPIYKLESFLGKDDAARCVEIRRDFYRSELAELDKIDPIGINDRAEAFNNPRLEDLEYDKVIGACCENVIGHVKVPVGLAGPLILDGEVVLVPLATTEGCVVASVNRGLSALRHSGGVSSIVHRDFMTRAPIVRFQDLASRILAINWLKEKRNKDKLRTAFNSTSSHAKFIGYSVKSIGREIHIRFKAQTGDAMGMNMCSKGVESALREMQRAFPTMKIVSLSGNMCTDKKPAAINWIKGRGKSVECNAEIPAHIVQRVFKVSIDSMVDRWKSKVMIGSALAASIGGFNSQAANIVTAIFIATGQDPAQNITSSNCILTLEKDSLRDSLVVCCSMPSIECGTVGGGTILNDQSRYLQIMGVRGPTPRHTINLIQEHCQQQLQTNSLNLTSNSNTNHDWSSSNSSNIQSDTNDLQKSDIKFNMNYINNNDTLNNKATASPASLVTPVNSPNGYTNARKLARIICATVMAGELSLLAALTDGTLVKSHMRHNRSSTNVYTFHGTCKTF